MQISTSIHTTLITINESKMRTKNLLHYIETNFSSYIKYKNNIIINYKGNEYFKRIFLIEWLYTLHTKVTLKENPSMKALLMQRIDKPIKIVFESVVPKIINVNVEIIDTHFLRFSLNIFDSFSLKELKTIVNKYVDCTDFDKRSLAVDIRNERNKERTKRLLRSENSFFYLFSDRTAIYNCLEPAPVDNTLYDSLVMLNSNEGDSIHVIRRRYKKLMKMYHPDNVFHKKNESVQEYTEKFQLIQNAFHLVKERFIS